MGWIGFLIAGLIIGLLARLVRKGPDDMSMLGTLGLGIVGSLIGGTLAGVLGTGSIGELNILGFVLSVVAAALLVGVAQQVTSSR